MLPAGQAAALYRCWTAEDADPPAALVGLLALLHCLNNGQIRYLRLADVSDGGTHLRVGTRVVPLAPPVVHALARYLAFRERTYGGPSTYLLVSRLSRLHDRPVSRSWFQANVLGGIAVASLRQTAIQHLIQGPACDGLQLAAYTSLSLERVGIYMRVFGAPAPWPPSTKGVSGSA